MGSTLPGLLIGPGVREETPLSGQSAAVGAQRPQSEFSRGQSAFPVSIGHCEGTQFAQSRAAPRVGGRAYRSGFLLFLFKPPPPLRLGSSPLFSPGEALFLLIIIIISSWVGVLHSLLARGAILHHPFSFWLPYPLF